YINLAHHQLIRSGAVEATFKAIKLGYLDFVKQITEANPDIVWSHDLEHSRDMLMYAMAHRQEEIAKFLYGLNAWRSMTEFTTNDDQNNMLHLVAKLPPSSPHIHHFPVPVLQMQNETWQERFRFLVFQTLHFTDPVLQMQWRRQGGARGGARPP
ncbi:hypothetical protein SLA2020_243710, partial [Shorea laevis]